MMQRKQARKLLGFKKKESQEFFNAIQVQALRKGSVPRYISACEGQPQAKAKPAQSAANLDSAPQNRKKPAPNLGEDQRLPTAGETIPIVFGKRTSGIGGVWVQPTLLKTGTDFFVGSFLYAISQGKIVSTPRRRFAWIGSKRIRFYKNSNAITLAHIYETAATLEASPTTCPILGGGLFCGVETLSFIQIFAPAEVGATYKQRTFYSGSKTGRRLITEGIGDTSNITFTVTNPFRYIHSGTGEDVTAELWAYLFGPNEPLPGPGTAKINASKVAPSGGRAVGTIVDEIFETSGLLVNDPGVAALLNLGPNDYLFHNWTVISINTQDNPSLPASTGTLFGVREEIFVSPFENPASVPTANNSNFADITFLKINGNIAEQDTFGTFPQTKQLSIYYAQGVEVDLYSGGLVNGAYAKGASNQLVDLLMYMFTLYKRADGANTADIASPIFLDNMTAIAAFCNEYNLHFNGVVDEAINIIDFGVTMAPFFLLSFLSVGGQYRFEPVLPLTSNNQIDLTAITPVETFSEDNILPGTFTKSFRQAEERRPFVAVLLYRENNPSEVGIQRTVEVAFNNTPIDAPQEQFDMTDFCADANHAAIYGKYQLARRKHITHSISFDTALVLTDMKPTQIIKIERQRISSVGDNRAEVDFYQITDIAYNTDGSSTVEAEHFPLDSNDVAVISDEIVNGSFRVLL
jgi:hypothetical protein